MKISKKLPYDPRPERLRLITMVMAFHPWLMISWGVAMWGWPELAASYSYLEAIASPGTWGAVMSGVGAVMLLGLYIGSLRMYRLGMALSFGMWGVIALNFARAGNAPSAVAVYGFLCIDALLTFLGYKRGDYRQH